MSLLRPAFPLWGPALLTAAVGLVSACGGAQPVEAVWMMPSMDAEPAREGGFPFAYPRASGVRGGDSASSDAEDAHPGDLPETMLTSSRSFWTTDEATAQARARESGRGLLIDFHADWCEGCRYLDGDTFRDHDVRRAILERYVPLRIDVTEETFRSREQLERYRVMQLPNVVLIDEQGRERDRVEAYLPPEAMLQRLGDARTATTQLLPGEAPAINR